MPSGYIRPDGTFVEHIDYPEAPPPPPNLDTPCGKAQDLFEQTNKRLEEEAAKANVITTEGAL